MKRLITLISTEGKTPEQVHKELTANLKKYNDTKSALEKPKVKSTIFFNQHNPNIEQKNPKIEYTI